MDWNLILNVQISLFLTLNLISMLAVFYYFIYELSLAQTAHNYTAGYESGERT